MTNKKDLEYEPDLQIVPVSDDSFDISTWRTPGVSGRIRLILSPTPPVECLSMTGLSVPARPIVTPLLSIASVR